MTAFLRNLRGQKLGLDTMTFIYAFEEHPVYLPLVQPIFKAVETGRMEAITSTITIAECLVQPYRKQNLTLAAHYLILFRNFPHLTTIPVTDDIAERAAFLRAHHNLKTPDAVQLATSLVGGASFFLTNDETLPEIKGIHILILDQLLRE